MGVGRLRLVAAGVGLVAILIVALVALTLGAPNAPAAVATAAPGVSQPPITTVTALPSPTTALPPGTFENKILGYRITLPEGYRRARTDIVAGQAVSLGGDFYTRTTEQQARAFCQSDSGDIGVLSQSRGDIHVGVSRNPQGISPSEWVTTPRVPGVQPLSTHQKVERTTINGLEAVRLVEDNARAATMSFFFSANDRIYELSPLLRPLEGASLDDIAQTFLATLPGPHPTPTATTPPREAASALAQALAAAFVAKDADRVAGLMSDCWLFVSPLVNGQPAGGVQYRSVALFTQGLRERFTGRDLDVSVDATLRTNPRAPESFVVRSEWKERDRTSVIDLYLSETGGRWVWFSAEPEDGWPCRRPWVAVDSC